MKIPPFIREIAQDPKRWGSLPAEVLGRIWRRDWTVLGGAVALGGNLARLDGCIFDLSHASLTLRLKSRFLTGAYERAERMLIRVHVPRNRPVLELGGCLGVLACIVNRSLEDPSRHVVVEANPELIPILERNRALNGAKFTIEHGAIAYGESQVTLMIHPELATSSSTRGRVGEARTVPAVTLAALVERYHLQRATLVMDIEGAEVELIRNDGQILADHVECLVLELHPRLYGGTEASRARDALQDLGFHRVDSVGDVEVWKNLRAAPSDAAGASA